MPIIFKKKNTVVSTKENYEARHSNYVINNCDNRTPQATVQQLQLGVLSPYCQKCSLASVT